MTTRRAPNVVVLTIDSVRVDRTSAFGYERPTTPNLAALARDGIACGRAFAPASFTEIAFPALMTSSRPLSYGGYDRGAHGRPPTLSRAFHDAGYRVAHLSNVHWINRFHGYGDGVDEERHFFVLNTVLGAGIATMMSTLALYIDGAIDDSEMLAVVRPAVSKILDDLDAYCDNQMDNPPPPLASLRNCGVVYDGYDYPRVKAVIARHRAAFDSDPIAYVRRYLCPVPAAHEWIAADWRYCRTRSALARTAVARVLDRAVGQFDPSLATLRANRRKRYADAAAMADLAIETLAKAPADRPLYLWCHFMDAHVPYCPGPGLGWYREARRYLAAVGYDPATIDPAVALMKKPETEDQWRQWSALYDAVLRFIDEQVGRILAALDRLGLADDTVIAVTADHGEELGDHGYISHYFRLYDHNLRVPMIFKGPGVPARTIDGMVSTLDFAPTVAALARIAPAPGWEGLPVTDPAAPRPLLCFETFFGGNCDFLRRPLYLAARSDRYKYMWKEYRDRRDFLGPDGNELYDLAADPGETVNLYRPDHPAVAELEPVLARRMAEIDEIPHERAARAFGAAALAGAAQ